ncbi:flagellar export chaperone FliS [Pusillimonas sp.]|uniref:flagellar export chaperone FliS n=1 Tax=Pusillimonas sp. TaxID=3040095 RepID=UPI0037C90723
MTYSSPRGARGSRSVGAYASIGLETQVLSATPEQLITLLFDGALAAIAKAGLYMQNGDIQGRGNAISKAIDIVDSGLKASLDMEAGGELSRNLAATYELIVYNLLQANLHADAEKLELAKQLLGDIGDAWRTASTAKETTPA